MNDGRTMDDATQARHARAHSPSRGWATYALRCVRCSLCSMLYALRSTPYALLSSRSLPRATRCCSSCARCCPPLLVRPVTRRWSKKNRFFLRGSSRSAAKRQRAESAPAWRGVAWRSAGLGVRLCCWPAARLTGARSAGLSFVRGAAQAHEPLCAQWQRRRRTPDSSSLGPGGNRAQEEQRGSADLGAGVRSIDPSRSLSSVPAYSTPPRGAFQLDFGFDRWAWVALLWHSPTLRPCPSNLLSGDE